MKNKLFFGASFIVFAIFTFATTKVKDSDKPFESVLIGLLGATTTTICFNAVSKAIMEEQFISDNPTQLSTKAVKAKHLTSKYLSNTGINNKKPKASSDDDSTIFEDVSESSFFGSNDD